MDDMRFSVPLFTAREAATHLGLARSTMRTWLTREAGPAPLAHRIAPDTPHGPSVPFIAMVEAHMLQTFRGLGLRPRELRESVTRLRRELGDEYILATRRLGTDGVNLLVDMSQRFEAPRWERARDGQRVIHEAIGDALKKVTWSDGDPYGRRLRLSTYEGADVIIDPRFAFGQPVLERSKIRVSDVIGAFRAGETPRTIADEYGIEEDDIQAVIRAALRKAA
jgi:uncharacterized protein (DUF433 family)